MLKISRKKIRRKNGKNKSFQFKFQLHDTNPPSNNVKCRQKCICKEKLAEKNIRQNDAHKLAKFYKLRNPIFLQRKKIKMFISRFRKGMSHIKKRSIFSVF